VHGAASLDAAQVEHRVVLVSGAQALIEGERFYDSYLLVAGS
jgi:hypothetical protein